nr:Chain D, Nuclear receptor coactivator 2 [Homo sapiens]
GHKILHRLLQ